MTMIRVGKIVRGAALGAAVLVAACGQKGPLYLPDASDADTTQEKQPKSAASETLTTPAIPTAPAPGVVQ
jgi:predicted small lipoprotein YifL